ncbi:PAS domain-containing sensor histidine kinase [Planomonospora venezuelensis]|uniref:histidine kinase n=1 Tax=Planomonospora venezuelensis TaxID=1999 RepID=A0A841D830_PLAVE|nr:PAS domain S-box protein [Planomonospora venezuelensis]MBB5966371.1 PAS domain S-box-containing protein [Planomonospora venezuelensis]GIN02802.1 histidine kinase [Planomonospora venezuelensis]
MPDAEFFDESGRPRGFGGVRTGWNTAEQALRESEERFRLLVQSVVDYAIFMLDPAGRIASWNAGAQRIKGYAAEEAIGRHFSVFYPPEDVASGKPGRELETAVVEGRLEDEGWRVRKDGTRFWANVVITALFDESGRLRGFGKVTRDMTERRTAERALDERGRLLSHLVHAQELERRRIAWNVHDDTIQSMVAVGMRLQLMADRLPGEHAAAMRRLNDAVDASITRLRGLTFRLHPPGIDRGGLVEGLSGYLDQVSGEAGLTYELQHDLVREPSPEAAIMIFRICQEALVNVGKHARAKAVTVSLTSADHGVLVRVADDGVGIDRPLDALSPSEHFGLIDMRERAETAGGWWRIHGRPGAGTTVEFWVPALAYGEEGIPL